MTVDNLDALPDYNVSEYGEEREYGREGSRPVYDGKRYIENLDAVGQVTYSLPIVVCMGDDDNFVTAVYQLGRELVDVTFDTAGLRKEEIANHGDVICSGLLLVGHRGGWYW